MLNMRLFLSAFIAFLIVFPIGMVKMIIHNSPLRKKQREQEREDLKKLAIERGHVVTAKLIKIRHIMDGGVQNAHHPTSEGIYEYFYDGKRYKFRYYSRDPEMTHTLYFVDNPRKATFDGALKRDPKVSWPVVYLIVLAVVYWIVGIST